MNAGTHFYSHYDAFQQAMTDTGINHHRDACRQDGQLGLQDIQRMSTNYGITISYTLISRVVRYMCPWMYRPMLTRGTCMIVSDLLCFQDGMASYVSLYHAYISKKMTQLN